MEIVEIIKLAGAIVGLVTGCFVVVDRFIRNRPMLYLEPTKDDPDYLAVVVRNVAREPIVVESFKCRP
jgi:hypothetical protein